MPTDCVWFDEAPKGPWRPGSCFPTPHGGYRLSNFFLEHVASTRPPISVVLPGRGGTLPCEFCIDSVPTDDENGAWTVTIVGDLVAGERPDITVTPSIDAVAIYHGHLTHGVFSDG